MAITPEEAQRILNQRQMTHQPRQQSPDFDVRGLAQQLAQGMLLSFSDEMIGVLAGVADAAKGQPFMEGYIAARDNERQSMANFRENNPGTALTANILGGILTGGAGFAAANAARVGGKTAALAVPAIEGAIAGVGASDAPFGSQTAIDAGQGALFGLAAGQGGRMVTRYLGGRAAGDTAVATADDLGRTAADRANNLGITLSLGEELADDSRKLGESTPNAIAIIRRIWAKRGAKNQKAINRAVLSRFGLQGDKLSSRALTKIENRANYLYDKFANQISQAKFSRTNEFRAAMGDAVTALKSADMNPTLKKELQKVARIVNSNSTSPKRVKRRLMEIRKLARAAHKNNKPDLADGYDALQDALFGALNPGESQAAKAALAKASGFWRDFKLIDNESVLESVSGNIKPSGLSNLLGRSRFARDVFTRNQEADNPIFEVGRLVRQIGENPNSLVNKFASSGTSKKSVLNQLLGLTQIPAALGNATQTGQRLATELGRRGTASGARAAGASQGN